MHCRDSGVSEICVAASCFVLLSFCLLGWCTRSACRKSRNLFLKRYTDTVKKRTKYFWKTRPSTGVSYQEDRTHYYQHVRRFPFATGGVDGRAEVSFRFFLFLFRLAVKKKRVRGRAAAGARVRSRGMRSQEEKRKERKKRRRRRRAHPAPILAVCIPIAAWRSNYKYPFFGGRERRMRDGLEAAARLVASVDDLIYQTSTGGFQLL